MSSSMRKTLGSQSAHRRAMWATAGAPIEAVAWVQRFCDDSAGHGCSAVWRTSSDSSWCSSVQGHVAGQRGALGGLAAAASTRRGAVVSYWRALDGGFGPAQLERAGVVGCRMEFTNGRGRGRGRGCRVQRSRKVVMELVEWPVRGRGEGARSLGAPQSGPPTPARQQPAASR